MAKLQGGGWLQIGSAALKQSGIKTGDKVRIKADGRGRLIIECVALLAMADEPGSETRTDHVMADPTTGISEQPDLAALFPEDDPEPQPTPKANADIGHRVDHQPPAKPKHKRATMAKVQVETKRSKPGLRRIGIPSTPGRKSML